MVHLTSLTDWLDTTLRTHEIKDAANACNGLQLETRLPVTKLAAAVDACGFTIRAACQAGAQCLIVHHGLLWSAPQRLVEGEYEKWATAIQGGLAVYSSHLPLDLHPELGNNAVLARRLGLNDCRPFLEVKGQAIGLQAVTEIPLATFLEKVNGVVPGTVRILGNGPKVCQRIGICTGGAGSDLGQAVTARLDTFVTGEAPHWAATAAEDLGINLILAGHYATETFGVQALAKRAAVEFGLVWEFIDHPTGL